RAGKACGIRRAGGRGEGLDGGEHDVAGEACRKTLGADLSRIAPDGSGDAENRGRKDLFVVLACSVFYGIKWMGRDIAAPAKACCDRPVMTTAKGGEDANNPRQRGEAVRRLGIRITEDCREAIPGTVRKLKARRGDVIVQSAVPEQLMHHHTPIAGDADRIGEIGGVRKREAGIEDACSAGGPGAVRIDFVALEVS